MHLIAEYLTIKISSDPDQLFFSATSFQPPWNVTASNTEVGSVIFDMSRFPKDKGASFFIISLNSTEENPGCRGHHGNDDKQPPVYLHMVNSSNSVKEVFGLPVSGSFTVVVYLVGKNDEIYKSEQFLMETMEGGEYYR